MTLILRIPAPADFITANASHGNYHAKARLVKAWREAAAWRAKAVRAPFQEGHVRIEAYVHRGHSKGGRWDPANWSPTAKAAIDGLVDFGVLADDSFKHVTGPDMRPGLPGGAPALTLVIRPHVPEQMPATEEQS